jgi:hypothetical protein
MMKNPTSATLLAGLLTAILIVVFQNIPALSGLSHEKIWSMFIFFVILGLMINLIHSLSMRKVAKENLVQVFLGIIVLRLLACAAYAGIIIYMGLENRLIWVADFFVIYILFLVFELISVVANLRAN